MKTLKEFLIQNHACKGGFDFAKDLTLEQFLKTCERGDWILWLFVRMNPDCLRYAAVAADDFTAAAGRAAARKQNQKLTAEICRKYLPLQIWDQSKI